MKRILCLTGLLFLPLSTPLLADVKPQVLAKGLTNPESVVIGPDGRIFVSTIGEFNKNGDGAIMEIRKGRAILFCRGLNDPKGLAFHQQWFYVTDKNRVLKINLVGRAQVLAGAKDFPAPPLFLNDIVVDPENGTLYVSDSGNLSGKGGAIYRIAPKGRVRIVTNKKRWPALHTPNGLAMDGQSFLLMVDFGTHTLHRIRLVDGKTEKVADGFGGSDGLAWDMHGQLFVSDWQNGRVFGIHRPGQMPKQLPVRFQSAADICVDAAHHRLLIPDMKAGMLLAMPTTIPGFEIDRTPLKLETTLAFPKLKWTGWSPLTPDGKAVPLRPLVLTHAGDGSNRIFVATQRGVIHHFPNDPKATKTTVFLDIEKKVLYRENENEQGLLGLAFHPNFKKNGEFFVFYSLRDTPLTNVLSRFRLRKDDPNRADPNSEEEILRIKRPFWNHDGGTIVFGPDGYLYVALGDGGKANDPFNNAQNLKTLLGSVLRIDINRKDPGKKYAVPKDNPFVNRKDARPEIWCYGLRNVWRMSFDRKTGKLWAGEVGQNLFEEIDILKKGGNYGWKLRESMHPFWKRGVSHPRKDLIEPIWEYSHFDVGLSITGGHVYRGKALPELRGHYIYGDYVKTKIWALRYDDAKKRVVANHPIPDRAVPILSFGEDQDGEVYLLTMSLAGQGIYKFRRFTKKVD